LIRIGLELKWDFGMEEGLGEQIKGEQRCGIAGSATSKTISPN
jgi:hypothetical protein